MGRTPGRRPHSQRLDHEWNGRRASRRAQLPGVVREAAARRGLARRLRGRVAAGKPDRPRRVHALQQVHRRLPRERDRLQLPDRPREMQGPSPMRGGLRRDRRRRFLARRARSQRELRPGARSLQGAAAAHARPAAGLPSARGRSARAGARRGETGAAGGRVREAALFRLPRKDLRPRPLGHRGLQPLPRGLLDRRDPRRRRSRQGRAAPVRRLRRLRERLSIRCDDLCVSASSGHRHEIEGVALDLSRGRRRRRLPRIPRHRERPLAGTGRRPQGSARRQGPSGARHPL